MTLTNRLFAAISIAKNSGSPEVAALLSEARSEITWLERENNRLKADNEHLQGRLAPSAWDTPGPRHGDF